MSGSRTELPADDNIYLQGSVLSLCLRTAAPAITIMMVNGLFTIVDTWFLGQYAGALELTSVTIMFPLYMVLVASTTLVSGGFSSIYARLRGAGDHVQSQRLHGQAVTLALLMSVFLMVIFAITGGHVTVSLANGVPELAAPGHVYMGILVWTSPLLFLLSLQMDALRCEGHIRFMFFASLFATGMNILLDGIFVAVLGYGAAGSAVGTVLAEALSLVLVLWKRRHAFGGQALGLPQTDQWKAILSLGLPSGINYVGMAVLSTVTLYCIQVWLSADYDLYAGVYGIITRLMTFIFLPLLGLGMSFQAIVGNNFGAGLTARSNRTLVAVLWIAVLYCGFLQTLLFVLRHDIGFVFVDDAALAQVLADILPVGTMGLFLFGPLLMVAFYFQAIGDAPRAALLGLARTWFFAIPLTILLPFWMQEDGIWYSGVAAEIMVLVMTVLVLRRRSRGENDYRFGLLEPVPERR